MARERESKEVVVTVAAQVFLRSASGRSVRRLGDGAVPADLTPFRAPPGARSEVERFLANAGFKVYADESGFALSIEGDSGQFARTFGIDAARVGKVAGHETVELAVPKEISALVEAIVVLPRPEMF